MKINCDASELKAKKWNKIFTLWPRKVGPNDCRWLEYIERKRLQSYNPVASCFAWEYRAIK